MVAFTHFFEAVHGLHTVNRLPAILAERVASLLGSLSNGAPVLFGVLILLGLLGAPGQPCSPP